MSDAPERIWANGLGCYGDTDMGGTEYVRADLHVTLAAEVEQLRKERDHWEKQARDAFDASLQRGLANDELRAKLARAEASAAVKVKALEWKQRNDIPGLHSALGCDGWLRNIRRNKQGRFEYEGDPATTSYNETKFFNTLDEAKAAAQADYERRIRSALTAAQEASHDAA